MTKFENVIAGLQRCCVDNCTAGSKCPYYSEKDCLTTLLYDALELLKEREWVSVKDRLPEDGDAYIVAGKKRNPGEPWEYFTDIAASNGRYIDGFWDTFNDWIEGNEVHITHWMNFPDPPKERKDDDE